jgi:hypothetical protein
VQLTNTIQILPLYETILLSIRTITRDVETLTNFSHILASAFFGRDDKPASVSEAFIEFWNSTCSAEEPQNGWPPEIQACLRSVFGSPVAIEGSGERDDGTYDAGTASGVPSERDNGADQQGDAPERLCDVYGDINTEGVSSRCPTPPTERQGDSDSSLGPMPSLFAPYLLASEDTRVQREMHKSVFFSPTCERALSSPSTSRRAPRTPHTPPPFLSLAVRSPTTPTQHTSVMSNRTALAHFGCTKPNKYLTLENKENVSPHASPSSRSSVLGKRRALDSNEACNVSKRAKKVGPTACAQSDDSVGFCPQKATRAMSQVQPLRISFTPQSEGSEYPNKLRQGSPVLSRKRKAVFMEAVEVLTIREVQRRRRHSVNSDCSISLVPILRPTASATNLLKGTTSEGCKPNSSRVQRTRSDFSNSKCASGAVSSSPISVKEYGSG